MHGVEIELSVRAEIRTPSLPQLYGGFQDARETAAFCRSSFGRQVFAQNFSNSSAAYFLSIYLALRPHCDQARRHRNLRRARRIHNIENFLDARL